MLPWAVVLFGAGCYTYTPTTVDALAPGTDTRVRIAASEVSRFAGIFEDDARLLEGRLIARSDDRLLLLVPVPSSTAGVDPGALHQRIDLPLSGIVEVETKRLDRLRTVGVIGAGAVVTGIAVASLFRGAGGRSNFPDDGGPSESILPPQPRRIRIPLLSIGVH